MELALVLTEVQQDQLEALAQIEGVSAEQAAVIAIEEAYALLTQNTEN